MNAIVFEQAVRVQKVGQWEGRRANSVRGCGGRAKNFAAAAAKSVLVVFFFLLFFFSFLI